MEPGQRIAAGLHGVSQLNECLNVESGIEARAATVVVKRDIEPYSVEVLPPDVAIARAHVRSRDILSSRASRLIKTIRSS